MFAADKLLVRHVEVLLPHALGGDRTGEGVGGATFGGNHDEELTAVFVEEAVGLTDRGGEVGQVLEDVDGDDAVKKTVGEREGLLAIADNRLDAGKHAPDIGGHVLAVFVGVVIFLLLGGKLLVVDVFAEAGADLEGRLEAGVREFDGKGVVEFLDHAVAVGQELVPELHELVAALLLLGSEDRENFGPFGGLHVGDEEKGKWRAQEDGNYARLSHRNSVESRAPRARFLERGRGAGRGVAAFAVWFLAIARSSEFGCTEAAPGDYQARRCWRRISPLKSRWQLEAPRSLRAITT